MEWNPNVRKIQMNNFPQNVAFYPHGIYIYKNNSLYVINHAYQKGGERVEIFDIVENQKDIIHLNYKRSIVFPEEFTGLFNSLVVVGDEDEIYITTFLPIRPQNGKVLSFLRDVFYELTFGFNIKMTYVYHYKGGKITRVNGSNSLMNNGITYDLKDKIYVVNLIERKVRVFKFKRENMEEPIFEKDIDVGYGVDNLVYDEENGRIYGGGIGKLSNNFAIAAEASKNAKVPENPHFYGAALYIDTKQNDKVFNLALDHFDYFGISVAIQRDQYLFMGSWCDDGILICKK